MTAWATHPPGHDVMTFSLVGRANGCALAFFTQLNLDALFPARRSNSFINRETVDTLGLTIFYGCDAASASAGEAFG
jgi:hypothetical protein